MPLDNDELEALTEEDQKHAKKYKNKKVDIVREGRRMVLPDDPAPMPYAVARKVLADREREEEALVDIHEVIKAAPWDGAVALYQAMSDIYGWVKSTGKTVRGFFGPVELKPDIMRVATDYDETTDVFWGVFEIPNISGHLSCEFHQPKKNGPTYFKLGGEVKRKNLPEIQRIAERAREIVATQSIYKGKAFRLPVEKNGSVEMQPETDFLDPRAVDANELIFSRTLEAMIEANLFAPVRHTDLCLKHGIPLKRGVLLEGPFGTGKTLLAAVMAQVCYENGWTFISIDKVSGLAGALEIAKLYEPAVVFAEDIDRSLSGERSEEIDGILNTIDGVTGKSAKIMTILTTNEVQKINQAMLRPGRLDAVISIQAPDAEAAERLLRVYGRGLIPEDEDLAEAGKAISGQIPAVIREVVERSKLHSISRGDEEIKVSGPDIITATAEMEHHLELLNRRESEPASVGDQFLEEVARRAVGDGTATGQRVIEIKEAVQKVLDCVE